MSQVPFQKFVPKKKNSLIKEEFKQAKKKAKKERAAAIDRRFEEKRQLKAAAKNAENLEDALGLGGNALKGMQDTMSKLGLGGLADKLGIEDGFV